MCQQEGYAKAVASEWLNEKEQRAWRGFIAASQMLATQIERDLLAASQLSMADYAVLVNLSEVEDRRLRATDLAERMSWSRSRLSHQVSRMELRSLVKREHCGDDARGSFVVLTDTGLETIRQAAPAHVASVRKHLLDHLSEKQIDSLGEVTAVVLDHLGAINALPSGCDRATIQNQPKDS